MAEEKKKAGVLRVGLAQTDSRLGDVADNLERHLRWIGQARDRGVELLVFPELSLTGYRLFHLTSRVALPASAPELRRLAEAAGSMAVVVGFVEESDQGILHNTSAVLVHDRPHLLHRKLYLPSYGIFQDVRFVRPGRRLDLASLPWGRTGVLICEDLWHPELARRLAAAGSRLLVVPSAGPGRVGSGEMPANHESWELLTRSTALVNTCWVLYCNRVGWEEGAFYPGASHIVRPGGEILDRSPVLEEHLLVADIDLREADRLRWRLPLVADERQDIEGPA
ncbi:MAG TPA: nitrilase-related carbon-nitrogen hydrolase [Thermoanaerobaculia bacterium]|jgi:predicted amidohydrolase|nr:nitrilase-related carbon-nitrogen hydrolase [Thermoanaerobaculia bacterium]